jgi:Arc/MetJ-type ribon-helix-helix transcriptional regulator
MESNRRQREQKKQQFIRMARRLGRFAGKVSLAAEADYLTVGLPAAEAGQIDLLVEQGLYSSRTEFLQMAARNLLLAHGAKAGTETASRVMTLGVLVHDRRSLEKLRAAGERLDLRVTGLLRLADDVTPELAREVIQSVHVSGMFLASPEVKAVFSA